MFMSLSIESHLRLFVAPRKLGTSLCVALLLFVAVAGVRAQSGTESSGTGGINSIQGRLLSPSGQRLDSRLKIRLESNSAGDLSVFSDSNGSFIFRSLKPGSYSVVVEGGDQFETVREVVYIEPEINTRGVVIFSAPRPYTVQIFMKPKATANSDAHAGILNAALAGVPKQALDYYYKAHELAKKGENEKAIEQLRLAVSAHPNFALALSETGALYLKLNQPDKAVEPFRAALKLTPEDYATLYSYGIALLEKGDLSAAESQFRHALKSKSSYLSARLYLGITLAKQKKLEDAEREFKQTVAEARGTENNSTAATAHYYLGGIYWAKHDFHRAADELESYLKLSPGAADAARVRDTVKELRAKS
jgi:Tfp pilus assembly protein PilF